MPELPDLVVLEERLGPAVCDKSVLSATVKQPVVIRNHMGVPFEEALVGLSIAVFRRHGPFLRFEFRDSREPACWLVIHPMLAGRFALENKEHKVKKNGLCFSLELDRAGTLHYLDAKKMGKVYIIPPGRSELIPRYDEQGLDLVGPEFNRDSFLERIQGSRKQVRVFIMDQTQLSAIGNAYADEILFSAGLHPKTFCYQLSDEDRSRLYTSIVEILAWGIEQVRAAGRPLEEKVRDHMRVRNRKGEDCPACGAKIRRASVLGYDAFFCPECQPAARDQFIDWKGK